MNGMSNADRTPLDTTTIIDTAGTGTGMTITTETIGIPTTSTTQQDTPATDELSKQRLSSDNDTDTIVVCENFNCHGFKQSAHYIAKRLELCDIMCLTETWLLPSEEFFIKNLSNSVCDKFEYHFKSSMQDIDPDYNGRPFGGLAVLVKKHSHYRSVQVEVHSKRVLAIALNNTSGTTVQLIVCVYMPFYNGDKQQTLEFIETVDVLQNLLDTYSGIAPVKLVGDFNVQLPDKAKLNKLWYRQTGFTRHSSILYDFMVANDMHASDLRFSQTVDYTFFCHARNVFTWIDHVLCLDRDANNVINCCIIPPDVDNVSDHLPVQCKFTVKCNSKDCDVSSEERYAYHPQPNWASHHRNVHYNDILCDKLQSVTTSSNLFNLPIDSDLNDAINKVFSDVSQAIHDATKEAKCVPQKVFKPKPYWCPELSVIRDKKRFWWSIWVSCGRPRNGSVFGIYKDLKKRFRKVARFNANHDMASTFSTINYLYKSRNMKGFWNKLKVMQHSKVNSSTEAIDFRNYYSKIMTDDSDCYSESQKNICKTVEQKSASLNNVNHNVKITSQQVYDAIKVLNCGVSAGADGISAEHLVHGVSDILCKTLAEIYSYIFSYSIVPTIFTMGIIIPILKKATLDANNVANFRPITISSVFSKIAEILIYPKHKVHPSQFGFQEGRGTSFVSCLINDSITYFNDRGSPVYLCSLDAEKCFDSIWHMGLLFKLIDVLPDHVWSYLCKWYESSYAVIRWNNLHSQKFRITKGMRQGSILSPCLFNIFLDEMMVKLSNTDTGLRIFNEKVNSCAYADDVTLFSSSITGLQTLINICTEYSTKWRFNFGVKKSKTIVIGKDNYNPVWYINHNKLDTVNEVELLGVTIDNKGSYNSHVSKRISACRRSMFRLSPYGMCYPGLHASVKSYLWKAIGAPTLLYGSDCIPLSSNNIKDLISSQGTIIKNVLGLSKRNHHTNLMHALDIKKVDDMVMKNTVNFYNRIFKVDTPLSNLQYKFLSHYIATGKLIKGSILQRIVSAGHSPVNIMLKYRNVNSSSYADNGIVQSLKYLIHHENYTKPWSDEYFMTKMLTKAF